MFEFAFIYIHSRPYDYSIPTGAKADLTGTLTTAWVESTFIQPLDATQSEIPTAPLKTANKYINNTPFLIFNPKSASATFFFFRSLNKANKINEQWGGRGEEGPCSSECFIYEATEQIFINSGIAKLQIINVQCKQNFQALPSAALNTSITDLTACETA